MPLPDHYATLGVPRDADDKAIKRAWRAKAREHHPDRARARLGDDVSEGGVAAETAAADARFRPLVAAWEALGDPGRRAAYDREVADEAADARSMAAMETAVREWTRRQAAADAAVTAAAAAAGARAAERARERQEQERREWARGRQAQASWADPDRGAPWTYADPYDPGRPYAPSSPSTLVARPLKRVAFALWEALDEIGWWGD